MKNVLELKRSELGELLTETARNLGVQPAIIDNDEVRINVEQIFKQLSPNTEVKVI